MIEEAVDLVENVPVNNESTPTPDPAPALAPVSLSAGAALRRAREGAGMHIAALAVAMKVPVKKLEALEADRLDLLPDAVFVRALAASMCRALKIDPEPILEKLPSTAKPKLNPYEDSLNAPFDSPGQSAGSSISAFLSKKAVLAVSFLLLASIALVFLPKLQQFDKAQEIVTNLQTPALPLPSSTAAIAQTETPKVEVPKSEPAKPEVVSNAEIPAADQAALATKVPPAVQQPASVKPAGNAADVAFKVSSPSWVEVVDAKGAVLLRRIVFPGEPVKLVGAKPMTVVVGRADSTEVEVMGKPFKIADITKENVARFEVK